MLKNIEKHNRKQHKYHFMVFKLLPQTSSMKIVAIGSFQSLQRKTRNVLKLHGKPFKWLKKDSRSGKYILKSNK